MKPIILFAAITGALVGAVLGVLIVRGFLLDTIEEIAWRTFWYEIEKGRAMSPDTVLKSTTFAKCLTGVIAGIITGGLAGVFIGSYVQNSLASGAVMQTVAPTPIASQPQNAQLREHQPPIPRSLRDKVIICGIILLSLWIVLRVTVAIVEQMNATVDEVKTAPLRPGWDGALLQPAPSRR